MEQIPLALPRPQFTQNLTGGLGSQFSLKATANAQEVSRKLRQMQSLCARYPGSGWVQPRDVRVLLRRGGGAGYQALAVRFPFCC